MPLTAQTNARFTRPLIQKIETAWKDNPDQSYADLAEDVGITETELFAALDEHMSTVE